MQSLAKKTLGFLIGMAVGAVAGAIVGMLSREAASRLDGEGSAGTGAAAAKDAMDRGAGVVRSVRGPFATESAGEVTETR